jgi:hypothetical protein
MEREQVEVTSVPALLGSDAPPDYSRKFVPGEATYYVAVDGVDLPPMTSEQYAALLVFAAEYDEVAA